MIICFPNAMASSAIKTIKDFCTVLFPADADTIILLASLFMPSVGVIVNTSLASIDAVILLFVLVTLKVKGSPSSSTASINILYGSPEVPRIISSKVLLMISEISRA